MLPVAADGKNFGWRPDSSCMTSLGETARRKGFGLNPLCGVARPSMFAMVAKRQLLVEKGSLETSRFP